MFARVARVEQGALAFARAVAFIGVLALLVVAGSTLCDVLLRWLFNQPIRGLNDINSLAVPVVIAACFPLVIATRGISAGKTGKVLSVDQAKGRVMVEGLNLVKKTVRKSQDNPQGGITDKEAAIAIANVRPYCPECKRGVRVRRRMDGDKRTRIAKKGGEVLDKK